MENVKELVHTVIKETCTHWICADEQELDRVKKELEQKLNDLVSSEIALAERSHEDPAALPLQNVNRWAYLYDNFGAIMLGMVVAFAANGIFTMVENIVVKIAMIINGS